MVERIRVTPHFGIEKSLDAHKRQIFVVCAIEGSRARIMGIHRDMGSARGDCKYLEEKFYPGGRK